MEKSPIGIIVNMQIKVTTPIVGTTPAHGCSFLLQSCRSERPKAYEKNNNYRRRNGINTYPRHE